MTLTSAMAKQMKGAGSRQQGQEEGVAPERATFMGIIASLGGVLMEKRKEALAWRAGLGIEQDWDEDEEFYQAIDRANPEGDTNVGKPLSPEGGALSTATKLRTPGRSSVFVPITRAYVDAAAARVSDMLLPNDDRPWQIKPTPVARMNPGAANDAMMAQSAPNPASIKPAVPTWGAQAAAEATQGPQAPSMLLPTGLVGPVAGAAPAANQPTPPAGMPGAPGQPSATGEDPLLSPEVAGSAMTAAEKSAEAAENRIEDWMVECQWKAEVRKMIEDAALLGTGVLKGPFPMMKRSLKVTTGPDGAVVVQEVVEIVPVSKRINPRNFWTDPAGGENHQAGSYCWELDTIGSRQLRSLLEDPSYIRENILQALREGPGKDRGSQNASNAYQFDIGATFPLWYFYGEMTKRDMIAAGVPEDEMPDGEPEEVAIPAMVVMVNDLVVKVAPSPLDAGGLPYDMFVWQRRHGMPFGKGVARQMRTAQRMLNAAVRAEMDNGALTAGPIWGIRKGWVEPIGGQTSVLKPRMGFYLTEQAPPTVKIQDALSFTNIESNIVELEKLIDRAMKFAEDSTGLPMLMQGQQGEATQTATGMTILNNNGSTVLRRIARTFDDGITAPHVRRYYYYLLQNEGNDEAKGDFQIDARGSTYLVERDLQAQNLNVLFPAFMQHPDVHKGRLAEEVAQANRLNFRRIMMTDAEKAERDKNPPPPPPQVQVAQIREEGATKRADADRAMKGSQFEASMQSEIEQFLGKLASENKISTDNIKAMLTAAVMKINGGQQQAREDRAHQYGMAEDGRKHDTAMNPPEETPGRAPAHAGFSQ